MMNVRSSHYAAHHILHAICYVIIYFASFVSSLVYDDGALNKDNIVLTYPDILYSALFTLYLLESFRHAL